MTQEQKVKAYDEAIDKVAYFIKKHVGFGCIIHPNSSEAKELFNIFPELKESDDDMIRKALIDYFDDANNIYTPVNSFSFSLTAFRSSHASRFLDSSRRRAAG